MALRAGLLFVAAGLVWIGTVFLGIGLYQALLLWLAPWAAGLLTGLAGFLLAGLAALIAKPSRRRTASMGAMPFGAATETVSRAVENHPLAAIAAAAAVGLIQSLIFGRRR